MKPAVFTFGTMHVDRIDVTGYTRLLLVDDELLYGRYIATREWIEFDEALPQATNRQPSKHPFRFFDKNTGIPY